MATKKATKKAVKKAAAKKSAPLSKRGLDDSMFAVSYRRYLTWKTAWVFETETEAQKWADKREELEGFKFKVERVAYMG